MIKLYSQWRQAKGKGLEYLKKQNVHSQEILCLVEELEDFFKEMQKKWLPIYKK